MTATDDRTEVSLAMDSWCAAVAARDKHRVLDHYHPDDSVLWGTLAARRRCGRAEIATYFDSFLAHENIQATLIDPLVRVYGDIAIHNGAYDFTWIEDGRTVTTRARYTMVYRREAGRWWIIDHHSSMIPENGI